MLKKLFFTMLCISLLLFSSVTVNSESAKTSRSPIKITSDRLEVFEEKRIVVFSGKVEAVQDDITLNANIIRLYYLREDRKEQKAKTDFDQDIMKGGTIERIEAEGNVRVIQGPKKVIGDKAIYYDAEQKIVVSGKTQMMEGRNIINGGKITFYLNEKRGTVERQNNSRVKATIYPDEKKKEGK